MGILGVILGLLAIVCAVMATLLFGTVGGIVAGIIGAVAIALGFLKRKKDGKGGILSIVIGALAVILAFSFTGVWSNAFSEMHKKALEYKPDGLWAKVTENTDGGFMGIIKQIPDDEASMDALMKEMDELNKLMDANK